LWWPDEPRTRRALGLILVVATIIVGLRMAPNYLYNG